MDKNNRLYAIKRFYAGGRLVTLEDDVLSVVRQVRELYEDRVTIEMDPDTGWFHFTGHENGTDYLIFSTDCLDARALDRLLSSDSHWRGHRDPYDAAEREQDELDAAKEAAGREQINIVGEKLAHALREEGKAPRLPLPVSIPRSLDA
jgi:hypothetical protein